MVRTLLSDEIWNKVQAILLGKEDDRGRTASNNRWFLEAVRWIAQTGSPWRDLPAEFAPMAYGIYPFLVLAKPGCLGAGGECFGRRDGNRAHPYQFDDRASAPVFSRGLKKSWPQALGPSQGGLSTKLHLAVDSKGRPLRLIVTEGQVADISCAAQLVEHLRTKAIIADKGYDADHFVQRIRATRAKVVIPSRSNCKTKRRYNRVLYRTRNLGERFFNRIKAMLIKCLHS
ncbi:MAG: IS5 family transposase [Burkholderia sp.]